MYSVVLHFIGHGSHEGTNEELRKAVPDYPAALEFLQSISAYISAERKLVCVSIELADN